MARIHPLQACLACILVPALNKPQSPSSVSGYGLRSRNHRVPRAPLPGMGVTHPRAASWTASEAVTLPSSLLRAHAPVPPPLPASVPLGVGVFAGCCHPLLAMGPSRHYPCNPCGGDWTHTPPCPPGALTHFFPEGDGLTSRETRSAHGTLPALRLPQGAEFRGCSHALRFNLPHSLDLQVAPTEASSDVWQPGRVHHA
jgi:hypothetical protein